MLSLIKLAENYIVDKTIPADKILPLSNCEWFKDIKQIKWFASLRPSETGLKPFEDDLRIYEEIQIFEVELISQAHSFDVARAIMASVKYPVVLFLKCNNKYRVSMSKLYKNRIDNDKYRVKDMIMTLWLFPYCTDMSVVTQSVLNVLDITQYVGMNLYDVHQRIFNEICKFKHKAMPRTKARRLVEFLIGKQSDKLYDSIFVDCDIYEFHPPVYATKGYVKKKTSNYILAHDWEDVWNSLQKHERTRNSLVGRKYKSMEELMNKFEEYEMR